MLDIEDLISFDDMKPQASYSSLTLHRKCAQAWYYRYGLGIEQDRDMVSPYLTIGSWWAALKAAERLERGRVLGTLLELPSSISVDEHFSFNPEKVTVVEVLEQSKIRWKSMTSADRDEFEDALGEPLPERLAGMFRLWDSAHADRFEREEPLAVEMFWKRELPRPEGDKSWELLSPEAREKMPPMYLIGYIDYVYFDKKRGMTVILDDKAKKSLGAATSALDDLMDSQLMLYAWGATPKLKRLGAKLPRAVSYDRVCSVAPKTPQVTATGGLSKTITAYDAETYKRWATTDGRPSGEILAEIEQEQGIVEGGLAKVLERMEPGPFWGKPGEFYKTGAKKDQPKFGTYRFDPKVYEKLLAPSETGRWTSTTFKPITRSILEAHLRSSVDTARDIFSTQLRTAVSGEASRNLDRLGCARCDFQDLCRAQLLGGPDGDYDLEAMGLRKKERRGRAAAPLATEKKEQEV